MFMVIPLNSLLYSTPPSDHSSYLIIHVIFVLQRNTNCFTEVRYFDEVCLLCAKKKKFRVSLNFLHVQKSLKILVTVIIQPKFWETLNYSKFKTYKLFGNDVSITYGEGRLTFRINMSQMSFPQ